MEESRSKRGVCAPIALFVYDRPEHTRRTLEALEANALASKSSLTVFCDGPRDSATVEDRERIARVREIVESRDWCGAVSVVERGSNIGLADSIRSGVDQILRDNDGIRVIEDDSETSPGFLTCMNSALDTFADEHRVMHVAGYLPKTSFQWILPNVFLTTHMSCWGWGTWKRAWSMARWDSASLLRQINSSAERRSEFDMGGTSGFTNQLERNLSGELRTWAVFWAASIYLAGGLCLMPHASLVRNTGVDGTGENFRTGTTLYDVDRVESIAVKPITARVSKLGRFYLNSFYRYGKKSGVDARLRAALTAARYAVATRLKRA